MWRADALEKTLMLGKTEGRRRRGRQRMRWLDGITDSVDMILSTLGGDEGQESLAGCSPWGCKESDATWWLNNNRPPTWQLGLFFSMFFFSLLHQTVLYMVYIHQVFVEWIFSLVYRLHFSLYFWMDSSLGLRTWNQLSQKESFKELLSRTETWTLDSGGIP